MNRTRITSVLSLSMATALAVNLSAAQAPPAQAQRPRTPPKLAVLIMVDQMRADYVEKFQADWTSGLKRLVTNGAWFKRAAYPYLTTVTCAGHATVSTGSLSHTHGIMQNAWYDREWQKMSTCTEDAKATDIGYTAPVKGGNSAWRLEVPSFADEMRAQRGSKVVTMSLKARSAIMMAGHGGDAVVWLSESFDQWQTSSAYTKEPNPIVKKYVDANPISADFGKTWAHTLPDARYLGKDDGLGEQAPKGWTTSFPHQLKGGSDKPDADYYHEWELSPFADAYLGRMAAAMVEEMQLGKRETTDVLAVSFSTPDLVGHAFGPDSHEVQDIYANLDKTLGQLFDRLDVVVGKGQWVVALSADHGVNRVPEQMVAEGKDAGRVDARAVTASVEAKLQAAFGPGKYVNRINWNDVYFEPGIYDRIKADPKLLADVLKALESNAGIQKAFSAEQVRTAEKSADPLLRAAALTYYPRRSGDILLAAKPAWITPGAAATHGSANADDQRVPVLFMGPGVKPGTYMQVTSPADVAPSLAALCGITMPKAEGHPLLEAVTPMRAAKPATPAAR